MVSSNSATRLRGRNIPQSRLPENAFVDCMTASYDIHSRVIEALNLADLRMYSCTCTTVYDEVQTYYHRTWSIDSILEPFIPAQHIPAFRRLQASTGTVISGSAALQFFTHTIYPEADLDLYVNCYNAREVGDWLEDIGCTTLDASGNPTFFEERIAAITATDPTLFVKPPVIATRRTVVEEGQTILSSDYSWLGMRAVISFRSPVSNSKIQLILAARNIISVILNFHSTVVTNLITAFRAYSLFGAETLDRKLSLIIGSRWTEFEDPQKTVAARQKYIRRGWKMVYNRSEALERRSFRPGKRRVGDKKCWIVNLPPVEGCDYDDYGELLERNSWVMGYGGVDAKAKMRYELVEAEEQILMRPPTGRRATIGIV
ncbi:hypothetical protein ONZ45_g1753 [Pleurotus djamor]|nr:hypothetical protein ONZ45_g1753 [Pleurotus djamor]